VPKTRQGTISGYFTDLKKLALAAASHSGKVAGVYLTLNPVDPKLKSRADNHTVPYATHTTGDADILRRHWLLADFDAKRPAGISATDSEHDAAIERARDARGYLLEMGFPTESIILGDSGNGGHLVLRIDLPNDPEATTLCQRCLQALDLRFSDDVVQIDLTTYNASRISKVYGTLTAKGDNTPERPHRIARLIMPPDSIVPVSRDLLEKLAATVPVEPTVAPTNRQRIDLSAWLAKHEIGVHHSKKWNGGMLYVFTECPWNAEHNRGEAWAYQFSNGALAAGCHHNSCVKYTWQDLREKFEPKTRAGLPVIAVNNRQLRDTTNDALSALYESNKAEPKVFQRGGNLVRVSIDEKQNPYIDPLTESSLRGLLTRAADFIKVNTNAKSEAVETEVSPPLDVVRDTLSLRGWQLPPLLSIIEVPVICSDGTIIDKIGYDAKTCLYYHPSPELRVPPVPDTPTESDVKAAKALLLEVICNFPFDSEASGANAVAAMLTPIVRPVIDGLVPLAVFDKPQPGTGASLLADVIAFIATGQTAGMLGGQRKEEEWRKAITTILLSGRSVICVDNIDGVLDSTSLATVLTARVWRDRILGRNEEVLLPNMATWIANGNNIRLAGDLPRRAYRVRLDAQLAQPWLRRPSEFEHPDLIKWVRQKRGDIIAAMLTVARSWVVAGKPKPNDLVSIGSYESFCEVLGGILDYIKVKGFLGNLQQMYSEMDVETPQWGNLLEAWQEVFGDSGVTVAEVAKKLKENEGFAAVLPDSLADKDANGYNRKLGNALARRKDVRFPHGLMIQAGEIKHHATAWKVVKAEAELPRFSFGGELGESGSTPRGCEDEKE
jgi:hypothetical protein